MRRLRFIPTDSLVEVSCRTLHGWHLLQPSQHFNDIFVGVLAKAQQHAPVRLHAVSCLSNHYHMLLTAADAQQLAKFMQFVNSNLAREAGRLHDWQEKIWGRRYDAIVVTHEKEAQLARLNYVLAQSCKEGLVESPLEWPGVHAACPLQGNRVLEGVWIDRTRQSQARRRKNRSADDAEFATPMRLVLEPLPCWRQLPLDQMQREVSVMVRHIEAQAAAERRLLGTVPVGVEALVQRWLHPRPTKLKRRPPPLCHAASHEARKAFREAYGTFVTAYRAASVRLRAGERTVRFPAGSFPPSLPFVPLLAA